jgi:hypothetical protein
MQPDPPSMTPRRRPPASTAGSRPARRVVVADLHHAGLLASHVLGRATGEDSCGMPRAGLPAAHEVGAMCLALPADAMDPGSRPRPSDPSRHCARSCAKHAIRAPALEFVLREDGSTAGAYRGDALHAAGQALSREGVPRLRLNAREPNARRRLDTSIPTICRQPHLAGGPYEHRIDRPHVCPGARARYGGGVVGCARCSHRGVIRGAPRRCNDRAPRLNTRVGVMGHRLDESSLLVGAVVA